MTSNTGSLHALQSDHLGDDDRTRASVTAALEKAAAASQQMLADRLDLLRLDATVTVRRTLGAAVLIEVGILVSCGAWFTGMAWLVSVSEAYAPLPTRLALVALFNVGIGIAAIVAGRRLMRGDKDDEVADGR